MMGNKRRERPVIPRNSLFLLHATNTGNEIVIFIPQIVLQHHHQVYSSPCSSVLNIFLRESLYCSHNYLLGTTLYVFFSHFIGLVRILSFLAFPTAPYIYYCLVVIMLVVKTRTIKLINLITRKTQLNFVCCTSLSLFIAQLTRYY